MGLLINQLKMQVSVLSLPVLSVAFLVLLQVQQHSATVDLAILAGAAVPAIPAIPAIGGGAVVGAAVLPAATTTALAGIAILGKIGLVLKGVLIGRALSARTTTMRPRHRGRRSVEGDDMEADSTEMWPSVSRGTSAHWTWRPSSCTSDLSYKEYKSYFKPSYLEYLKSEF